MTPGILFSVLFFVVAAALWFQSRSAKNEHEGFTNIPADLNKAPVVLPASLSQNALPTATVAGQQQKGIPGATSAPREALATRKDLMELENKIATWLAAATQYESSVGLLTPDQNQRRVVLQARLTDVLKQLGTSNITDSHKTVSQEINTIRVENTGWGAQVPSIEEIHAFGRHNPDQTGFLTREQYHEFLNLFNAVLNEFKSHVQPNPLEKVRLQQLEVLKQSLPPLGDQPTIPIRLSTARLFLEQALRPDQPLPTLFSVSFSFDSESELNTKHIPQDIQRQINDIEWKLTVTGKGKQPHLQKILQGLKETVAKSEGTPTDQLRSQISSLQNDVESYDPDNYELRVDTLCHQLANAFSPTDAAALGCPSTTTVSDSTNAETIFRTVCNRIQTSVPTVSPRQFNC